MIEDRTCGNCGRIYQARRKASRYCSARCRVAANRKGGADSVRVTEAVTLSVPIDPDTVDPRQVLAEVAMDRDAPAAARVAAAKALLAGAPKADKRQTRNEYINARAIEMQNGFKRLVH